MVEITFKCKESGDEIYHNEKWSCEIPIIGMVITFDNQYKSDTFKVYDREMVVDTNNGIVSYVIILTH